jgi:nickel/cobalt transporter (NicO) family protein
VRAATIRRCGLLAGLITVFVLLGAGSASAHPLGNLSVNSFTAVRIAPDSVLVDVVVDRAEIPTRQLPVTPTSPGAQLQAWQQEACAATTREVHVSVNGRPAPAHLMSVGLSFPPGAAGLPTSRLTCRMSAPAALAAVGSTVTVQSEVAAGRVGWHEMIAMGDRTTLTNADVPAASVSHALSAYPADLLSSPPEVRSASAVARVGGPPADDPLAGATSSAQPQQRGNDSLTSALTNLVGRHRLGPLLALAAIAAALTLGALHSLAPGHGKAVMAAYLVGSRGNMRQAAALAGSVTLTHTLGVLVLGAVLSTSASVAPERIYPWLGLASGLIIVGIGITSLLRITGRAGSHGGHFHLHPHPHEHTQSHHGYTHHGHSHDDHHDDGHHPVATQVQPRPSGRSATRSGVTPVSGDANQGRLPRKRSMFAIGFAGGLIPTPSALVVLLGAISLHRAWFGVLLVLVYGIGMGCSLVGIGSVLARLPGRLMKAGPTSSRARQLLVVLPTGTATIIVLAGAIVTVRAGLQL